MTYTPEDVENMRRVIAREVGWADHAVAEALVRGFVPGYDRRIQAETLRDAADDYDGLWPSVRTWLQDRAAALAAPVEQEITDEQALRIADDLERHRPAPPVEQPDEVMTPGALEPTEPYHGDGVPNTVLHDLRAIMAALGIDDYARPYSPHEVVQREVLPAIERLRAAPPVEQPPTQEKRT